MEELKPLGGLMALASYFVYALAIGVLLMIILIPVLLYQRKKARQAEQNGDRKKAVPHWIAVIVLGIVCGLIGLFVLAVIFVR